MTGTPKRGVRCQTCQDWGDIVEDDDGSPIPPMPCPDCAEPAPEPEDAP